MVRAGSTLVGESMKPPTARIGLVVSENTRHKDSFIYIVDFYSGSFLSNESSVTRSMTNPVKGVDDLIFCNVLTL